MQQNSNTDTGDTAVQIQVPPALQPPPSLPPPPSLQLRQKTRESAVNTAISFLQNPAVARSSIVQKQNFLRSKGLTDDEIQIACDRAGVFSGERNSNTVINMGISHTPAVAAVATTQSHGVLSLLHKVREVLSSTAVLAGLVYAIYVVYKRFIEPLLFGKRKKKRTVEDAIESMEQKFERNIADLNTEVVRVRDEFRNSFNNDHLLQRELMSFKGDLEAIKGLLLNRKQFSSPLVPPSIPVWQLQSQRSVAVGSSGEVDKNDDAGSADGGSGGSSETEVVTKNSDSSLELIS